MAIVRSVAMLVAAVVLLLRSQAVLSAYEGILECEELTALECAFAVSSAGARCVLEKSTLSNGKTIPSCQTSLIMAERPAEWIESDECIHGCGLERETYGLSTDLLVESGFRDKLCSSECQTNCPNIVDIYYKLAAGEGVYLPRLCNEQKFKARRLIDEQFSLDAQNGPQRGQTGGSLWASTHMNSHGNPWDSSSLASSGTPSPIPSPVYGVPPPPPAPKEKTLAVSISSVPSPVPAPTLGSPVSQPAEEVSIIHTTIGNDFGDGEN
ncbi:unnamed protein product [Calypogeia fissa]